VRKLKILLDICYQKVIIDSEPYLDGGIIFDPFLGSGSVLIASQKQDKICVGLELMPLYCDVIVKRYVDFVGSSAGVFVTRNGEKIEYEELQIKMV
jgi:DNA modification methylase